MHSKIVPTHLRQSHPYLFEALALVWHSQHFIHQLMPEKFIVSTDHQALLRLFRNEAKLTTQCEDKC